MRATIPPDYQDHNGHMNVRHYLTLFDEAGFPMVEQLGLTPDYLAQTQSGGFDHEHHIHYLREVMVGDEVAIYVRMVGRSAKRMHYLMFMVNETRGTLAALFECVNSFADLRARRTAPWPAAIAAALDDLIARSQADWPAPVCGVMSA
jgi:acyl-CoA thioester hydrolase